MKELFSILLCCLALGASSHPTFEEFKQIYKKTYVSSQEESKKRKLKKRHKEISHLEVHMEEIKKDFSTLMKFIKTELKGKE